MRHSKQLTSKGDIFREKMTRGDNEQCSKSKVRTEITKQEQSEH